MNASLPSNAQLKWSLRQRNLMSDEVLLRPGEVELLLPEIDNAPVLAEDVDPDQTNQLTSAGGVKRHRMQSELRCANRHTPDLKVMRACYIGHLPHARDIDHFQIGIVPVRLCL